MRPQLEKALLEATNAHPWIAKFKVGTAQTSLTYLRMYPRIHAHSISTISETKWFKLSLCFFFFEKQSGGDFGLPLDDGPPATALVALNR